MFYIFRYKEQLQAGELNSYRPKLQEPGVINIINGKKSLVEPFGDLVDGVFLNFWSDLPPRSWNPFIQKENDDDNRELLQEEDSAAQQSDDNRISEMRHSFYGNITMSVQIHTVLSDDDVSPYCEEGLSFWCYI